MLVGEKKGHGIQLLVREAAPACGERSTMLADAPVRISSSEHDGATLGEVLFFNHLVSAQENSVLPSLCIPYR